MHAQRRPSVLPVMLLASVSLIPIMSGAAPAPPSHKIMDEAAKLNPPPVDRWALVQCGSLLDIPGNAPRGNSTVIVHGKTIHAVMDGFVAREAINVIPPDAEAPVVDLRSSFVLPGLIDCHVHMTFEWTADSRMKLVTDSEADAAMDGVEYARRTIEAGFTTVRDVGAAGDAVFALRDAIESGKIIGPRILAAGRAVTPTGGHADRTLGYREDLFAMPTPLQGAADGVDMCRQAVRAQVKRGADCIKLTATGGVLSNTAAGMEQQFFDDELKAIVDTAHLLNRKVAAHAHGTRGINAALRAGVDSIEHGTFIDDESIRLFKEKGTFYVPTIIAGKTVAEHAETPGYYTLPVVEKARLVGPRISETFAKAYKAGVKIAFGTDAGVYPHGINAMEFGFMVNAGMPPAEAIKAATVTASELLGTTDRTGTLEPGKAADLIAVAADPLKDIEQLMRVAWVMKDGRIVKSPGTGR
ncbi:MAG TPA: amidohydrolase family protein [Phycisphaerales bacterium]|nr:amidohydrolase family protein [Phycisphaerales bacterium]